MASDRTLDCRSDHSEPVVSVILPCYNEARCIAETLRNVLWFEAPPGGDFEVLIVDGGSADGTRQIALDVARTDERVRVLDNPQRLQSCGLNIGLQHARADIVVRLDAHTDYAPDYLRRCIETLDRTGADEVGGPWIARGSGYLQQAIAAAFACPFATGGPTHRRADYDGPVESVYLGCWRRLVFDRIGPFAEDVGRNEDEEWDYRLLRAGGRIWQSPLIRSWYRPRSSLRDLFRQHFQWGYWKVRVACKHRALVSWRHPVPAAFVAGVAVLSAGAVVNDGALTALAVLLSLYGTGLALASAYAGVRCGWRLLPVMPAVIACYHVGYGIGVLAGLLDFVVLGRSLGRCLAVTRS